MADAGQVLVTNRGAASLRTSSGFTTALGAKTMALVAPDCLYVFSPRHQGALVLGENWQAGSIDVPLRPV